MRQLIIATAPVQTMSRPPGPLSNPSNDGLGYSLPAKLTETRWAHVKEEKHA